MIRNSSECWNNYLLISRATGGEIKGRNVTLSNLAFKISKSLSWQKMIYIRHALQIWCFMHFKNLKIYCFDLKKNSYKYPCLWPKTMVMSSIFSFNWGHRKSETAECEHFLQKNEAKWHHQTMLYKQQMMHVSQNK